MIGRIFCRPFIGRHEELAFLRKRRLEAAGRHGSVVLISGEAGVGKSRLLAQFRHSLGKTRMRIAAGQCLEFVQRPYGPVLEVLRQVDSGNLDALVAEAKYEQLDAIVDGFIRAAAHSALIVIFEDLHWADAATLEVLALLSTKIEHHRILVLASYRPDDSRNADPGSMLDKIERRATRMDLPPLSGPELRQFIDEALAGFELASDTRSAIARISEGNPFFTEELLKSAVDIRDVAPSPGRLRQLPETVRAAVLVRLRPLDGRDREVLAQAAVIGRRFELRLLCETLGADRDAVLAALQRARTLQLLDEERDDHFRFRHALTREVIYNDFLSAQVRPLHRKIALVLGASPEPDLAIESLAYHWSAAGDRERGAYFNEAAGDAAGAVFAHDDAIRFYEQALQLAMPGSRERATLLSKIGRHRASLGSHIAAHDVLNEAADISQELGDFDSAAIQRIQAAQSAHIAGASNTEAPLEAMLGRLPSDARRARSRLHLQLGWYAAGFRFRADDAIRHLADVDETAVFADADMTRTYHSVGALAHCLRGDVAGLRAESDKALAASLTTPHSDRTVWIEINTAMEFACLDLRDEAKRHFSHAREMALDRKNRNLEAHIYAMSASVLYIDGDLDGVRRAVDAAAALRVDSTIMNGHCAAWGTLAGLALGDARLIDTWFVDSIDPRSRAEIDYFAAGYAEILLRRGRMAEAKGLLRDAIAGGDIRRGIVCTLLAVGRIGDDADVARARALLVAAIRATVDVLERPGLALFEAFVARRAGRFAAAVDHALAAATGFRDHRAPLLEASALEVAAEVDAALAIYRRLGAIDDVRRIESRSSLLPSAQSGRPAGAVLSKREMEIAMLVAQGSGNLIIAQRLAISHKTVEAHLSTVFKKLELSSRTQLAMWVARMRADDL